MGNEIKVTMRKLAELVPYENNPRDNSKAVDAVAESIKEFGFKNPIIVDKGDVIVAGHTRLKAAEKLGLDEVPVIVADDLSDEQVKAFRLADNKTAELAEWNFDLLETELAGISEIDMSAFGFDMETFAESSVVEEDDYSGDVPDVPRTQLGDLWQMGGHRLICGDSTDIAVIDRLMDGVKADMVFTDPPYGMNLDTDFSKMHSENNHDFQASKKPSKGGKYQKGKVDEFHPEMINAIFEIDADEMFLWGADYYAELLPNKNDGSWIVWDKRMNESDELVKNQNAMDKGYGSCFELCWSKKKHKREIARVKWSGLFGMEKEDTKKRVHPTQKPNVLAKWFIEKYSKKGDLIVDIFGGSGSTLIACEQINRKCYMAELDPKYCDVIIQRWEEFTGQKAKLIHG